MVESPKKSHLRLLRDKRGWTQIQVARAAGLNITRYWYIETGNGRPTKEEVQAIANVFGLSVKATFGEPLSRMRLRAYGMPLDTREAVAP